MFPLYWGQSLRVELSKLIEIERDLELIVLGIRSRSGDWFILSPTDLNVKRSEVQVYILVEKKSSTIAEAISINYLLYV